MLTRPEFGRKIEAVAGQYLESVKGWRVLERRARFREGELDLIAETPQGELRFVEVKGRRSLRFGGVVESVTTEKVRRLRRAVYRWRERSKDRRPGALYFLGILVTKEGPLTIEEHLLE